MAALKIPPHNEEAEASVLGAILIEKDAISVASGILSENDFYSSINGAIFSTMLSLYEEGKPIDILTVKSNLKKNKTYQKIEPSYLADLVNTVPTAANIEHYAGIIKEASTKRALISAGSEIVESAFSDEKDVEEVLNKAESKIFAISQKNLQKNFVPLKETLAESFDRIDELHKKGVGLRGVKTGFTDLDNTLSGMQSSNLLILAARPGQGKTAMIVNIAQNIAVNDKLSVGIFSLEMSKEELVDPGRRYDNRVQEVSIVSQSLKNLARELKIPILAVSQLSRAVEHRGGDRKPQLADLRESGAIEQDADVVMFLYRPDAEMGVNMVTKLLIAKHRNGPTGEIDLLFRGDRLKFYDVEKKREE